ncbi:hypothetical protein [Verrucomicrobium spinosum]|uniref:hypothetical protein n=1 Tax=Verrucomicrobium spinosum TaxID=2736 RepID=UPI000ACB7FA0|nr:hypothetical protein [Verrucomicrobium spinosum]
MGAQLAVAVQAGVKILPGPGGGGEIGLAGLEAGVQQIDCGTGPCQAVAQPAVVGERVLQGPLGQFFRGLQSSFGRARPGLNLEVKDLVEHRVAGVQLAGQTQAPVGGGVR